MLDGSFDYGAYVEWALKAPLLFLRRNGDYAMPAMTFGELVQHGFEGRPARRRTGRTTSRRCFPRSGSSG